MHILEGAEDDARSLRFRSPKNGPCFDGEAAFCRMRAAWKAIVRTHRGQLIESVCILAGQTMRMRGVCAELAERITEPFRHLRNDTRKVLDLKIDFWDESEAAFPCPVDSLDAPLRLSNDYGYVIGS